MSADGYMFTAYSVISGNALHDGDTAAAARDQAVSFHRLPDATAVEVLAFRRPPPSIDRHTLRTARRHGITIIHATFYQSEIST